MQEGFLSIVRTDGAQRVMPLFIRTDGDAEVAMVLAAAALLWPARPGSDIARPAGPGAASVVGCRGGVASRLHVPLERVAGLCRDQRHGPGHNLGRPLSGSTPRIRP